MSVPFLCCHHHQTLAIPLSAASSASSPYLPPFLPRLHTSVLLTCLPSIPLPFRPSLTPSLHPLARPSALWHSPGKNRTALQPKAFRQHACEVGTRWHPRRHLRFCASHRPQYDWRSRHPWAPARHPLQEPLGAAAESVSATRQRGRHPLAPASAPAFLATSHRPQYELHPLAQSAPVGTRSAPAARTARRCSQKRFRNTPARSAPAGTRVGTRVFCNKS